MIRGELTLPSTSLVLGRFAEGDWKVPRSLRSLCGQWPFGQPQVVVHKLGSQVANLCVQVAEIVHLTFKKHQIKSILL